MLIIGTAPVAYGAGSMQLPGVRPSRPGAARGCCGFAAAVISIDCCTTGGQQQRRRSTARSSKCEQCHVVS